VVADGERFSLVVILDEVRIDLRHLLREQAVLGKPGTVVNARLVMERDRTELHQVTARLAHVLDVFLET
jgi:hypothetical protein